MKIKDTLIVLFIVGAMSLVANAIGTKYTIVEAIPGLLFLIFLAIAGVILAKYLPGRIPAVAYIVTLGCILTYPTMPGSDVINEAVKKVGFLQLCTPILAYAGIAIGKDLDAFAKSGWRIVVVACVVFTGTYIGSAIIAQTILRRWDRFNQQYFQALAFGQCFFFDHVTKFTEVKANELNLSAR